MRKMRWQTQFAGIGNLAAVSLGASIWGATHHAWLSFYLLPTRAWELAAGVLLAIFEANRPRAWISMSRAAAHSLGIVGLGLICLAISLIDHNSLYPGYAALLPVCGAAPISQGATGNQSSAVLATCGLRRLVSYSFYLWHWPMLSFAHVVLGTKVPRISGITIGLLSFLCAVLSYKFVEQPFLSSTTPKTSRLKSYAVAMAIAMIPAIIFCGTNGCHNRNRSLQSLDRLGAQLESDECLVMTPNAGLP